MIYKNSMYFKTEGVTILEFGKGDIAVSSAESLPDSEVYLFFRNTPEGTIGELNPAMKKGMTADDAKPDVIMVLSKVDSIDVIILALQEAKENLQRIQQQNPEQTQDDKSGKAGNKK